MLTVKNNVLMPLAKAIPHAPFDSIRSSSLMTLILFVNIIILLLQSLLMSDEWQSNCKRSDMAIFHSEV